MAKRRKKINWRWVLTTGILSGIVCVLFVTFSSKNIAEGIIMGIVVGVGVGYGQTLLEWEEQEVLPTEPRRL